MNMNESCLINIVEVCILFKCNNCFGTDLSTFNKLKLIKGKKIYCKVFLMWVDIYLLLTFKSDSSFICSMSLKALVKISNTLA